MTYFDDFLSKPEAFEALKESLEKAMQEGHNARIRTLAGQTIKHMNLFREVCEAIQKDHEKLKK